MGDVRAPQGVMFGLIEEESTITIPQGLIYALYNIPAEQIQATFGSQQAAVKVTAEIDVPQALIFALVRGTVANPVMRVWTYDMDGHEMYVFRLGDEKTLVWDKVVDKWYWWADADFDTWRAHLGTNWIQSGDIAQRYGSNVVAGDDSTGILWVLDPMQGYDDSLDPVERAAGVPVPFERVATGQVITRAREFIPCFQVYLFADGGAPAFTGATVSLKYSDDQGRTYKDAGTIVSVDGSWVQEFAWRSLGQIGAPGRMFRIEDNGAFPRINEMSIYNG